MVQSALLAALALGGVIQVWEVLALSVFQGLIDAFDMPVRQSMVVQMVEDRADLPNAIALNSSMVNAARLLGPAIAGVLIAAVGEGWCFFIDALSYGAVILSVLLMRLDARPPAPKATRVLHEMAEGFRYASGFAPIRALLLLLAVVGPRGEAVHGAAAGHRARGDGRRRGDAGRPPGDGRRRARSPARSTSRRARASLGLGRVVVASAALFGLGLIGVLAGARALARAAAAARSRAPG